jgi:hypothetical protein
MRNATSTFTLLVFGFGSLARCAGNDGLALDPSTANGAGDGASGQATTQPATVPPSPTQSVAPPSEATPVTGCPSALVVEDPTVALTGVAFFQPDQKRGNPEAGQPSYVYLAAGKEGVILTSPSVTPVGETALDSPSITLLGVQLAYHAAEGYDVVVNPNLKFHVAIDDFEFEVALARVELCEQSGELQSQFVFKANEHESGVAHDITISPITTLNVTSLPPPVTVEVR